MKKIFWFFVCIWFGLNSYGQSDYSEHVVNAGVEAGEQMFSVFVGMASPRGKSGVYVGNSQEELAWGENGLQYGIEGMYFATPYIGYGGEISGMNTTYASKSVEGINYRTAMDMWNGMLRLRLNINPQSPVRVYVPLGGGLTYARGRCYAGPGSEANVARNLSFGYFVGLGVETSWRRQKDKSVGLEVRYYGFEFDTDKMLADRFASGNKNYGYLSVLLKLNYRF